MSRLVFEEVHYPRSDSFDAHGKNTYSWDLNSGLSKHMAEKRSSSMSIISNASKLTYATLSMVLGRADNQNPLPLIIVTLTFVWNATRVNVALTWIEESIPRNLLWSFLNTVVKLNNTVSKAVRLTFPEPKVSDPVPEDYVMHGHIAFQQCFPHGWFRGRHVDAEDRCIESPRIHESRTERILWLGLKIAVRNNFKDS